MVIVSMLNDKKPFLSAEVAIFIAIFYLFIFNLFTKIITWNISLVTLSSSLSKKELSALCFLELFLTVFLSCFFYLFSSFLLCESLHFSSFSFKAEITFCLEIIEQKERNQSYNTTERRIKSIKGECISY